MHDFDFDALQKKRIARSAAHMKRGSKSKKCSLPSDSMTAAEWKRRNGPVNTYKLDAPMSWESFKSMPLDLQQTYVAWLQNQFNVPTSRISEDLFGKSVANLRLYASKVGLKYRTDGKGRKLSGEESERWHRWLRGDNEPDAVDTDEEVIPLEREDRTDDPEVQEIVEKFKAWQEEHTPTTPDLDLEEITAIYRGNFNPERFLLWLSKLPVPAGNVEIRVDVKKV